MTDPSRDVRPRFVRLVALLAACAVLPAAARAAQVYLSTQGNGARLGGLTFRDGDLVDFNPVTGTASLFFNEDLFAQDEDIDGVHVLSDGSILLSTRNGASIGGITFLDGDVVRYVPSTNTATILLPESTFGNNVNVDGVFFAPEPGTGLLLAFGLAGLALRRTRVPGLRAR
jgi:PEP-CTERM motif-containing protein